MPLSREKIRTLIEWLGEEGARAGLDRGHLTVKELRGIATDLDIPNDSRATRKDTVAAIIAKVNLRIDKSKDDLLKMSAGDLLVYFEDVRPSKAELLALLLDLDFHPGSEAQKSLYKYAARQISETGMFERVASNS